MAPSLAIEAEGLCKVFGDKVAVADLRLQVERGEVFGFLGPNGAGKTTAVKMLLGLITPTSGSGKLLGKPLGDYRVRNKVGFLPEHFRFHEWLTATEFLRLHADLYHMRSTQVKKRISELLDLVGLTPHADKKLAAYSKGMLQRIGLAQALLNEPDLVILDEPTSGLDPMGRRLVRDIIRSLRQKGATIFLNSHLLSEVEVTCDRVAFIKSGEVVRVSALTALMDGELSLEIHTGSLHPSILKGLVRWGQNVRLDHDRVFLTVESESVIPSINQYLVEAGVDIFALTPRQSSLEELFIQIVGQDGEL